jgi:hypothetical protein
MIVSAAERRCEWTAADGFGPVSERLLSAQRAAALYLEHMPIRVECCAGYRGEQEPLAFWLGERRVAVRAIADRWYSPAQRWFKVEAEDGDTYILRDDGPDGQWELAAFTSAKSPGTG